MAIDRVEYRERLFKYAEQLASEVRGLAQELGVDASVETIRELRGEGPFVEMHPPSGSSAQPLSIYVFDFGSAAVTIGETASSEFDGEPDAMLDWIKSLARDLVEGRLSEEVVRNRRGEVQRSKLLRETGNGPSTVWTRWDASAWLAFGKRDRQVHRFPAYPSATRID